MAEGDITFYNNFKEQMFSGLLDFDTDVIKCMLVSSYTPNIDTHVNYASVSASEYGAGSGYTVGGATITTPAFSQDDTDDEGVFDCDNITWTSLGPLSPNTPSHAIFYFTVDDVLICYVELGVTPTNGQDYTLQVATEGLININ
jgi:hypothetical protein